MSRFNEVKVCLFWWAFLMSGVALSAGHSVKCSGAIMKSTLPLFMVYQLLFLEVYARNCSSDIVNQKLSTRDYTPEIVHQRLYTEIVHQKLYTRDCTPEIVH